MKLLVLYYTKTGHTLEAITPFIEGVKNNGAEVQTVLAEDFDASMMNDFDSFVVGTPCWAGSSGLRGVAGPLVSAIKKLPKDSLKDKLCGGIAIHAQYGGNTTLSHLKRLLKKKGGENFKPAPVVKAGVLMSVTKGPSVTKDDEEKLKKFGEEFAQYR